MTVQLTKDSIDLGIVVRDSAKALAFYRDTLGFEHVGTMPMPGGSGTMERLLCGTSVIKLVVPGSELPASPAAGGIQGSYGYRYWTISVSNLTELVAKCEANGYRIAVPEREIRPGVRIAIVEDSDGNLVEFLQQ